MQTIIIKGEKLLRDICLTRAGFKCELCDDTFLLDMHHILPKSIYAQHRLQPMNIIILCRLQCHNVAERYPVEFMKKFLESTILPERVSWILKNIDVNRYPTEVNYEAQYEKLLTQQENIFGV